MNEVVDFVEKGGRGNVKGWNGIEQLEKNLGCFYTL